MSAGLIKLPKYRCHKEVYALKIAELKTDSSGITLIPADTSYAPFGLSSEYVTKHSPEAGGYWVSYKDGYTSYSPAEAFEEGYTLTEN